MSHGGIPIFSTRFFELVLYTQRNFEVAVAQESLSRVTSAQHSKLTLD